MIDNINDSLIKIPFGMGCWAYGGGDYWGDQSQSDVNDIVSKALELGINFFDTAEMYNYGASETSLGIALKGKREKAIITSKINPSNAKPKILKEHLEASLKRLKTDYLNIYMMHWPINRLGVIHFKPDIKEAEIPTNEEAFFTLAALKKEGKIKHIGVSNYGCRQMQEILSMNIPLAINELPYNILVRAIEKDIIPFCKNNSISILGYMTLQQGLLAGIYNTVDDVPSHQAHSRHFNQSRFPEVTRHDEQGAEKETFACINALKRIAAEMGIHIAQLSIAWVRNKGDIALPLVGSRNIKELLSNYKAANIVLTDDIIDEIDNISQPVLDKLGYSPDMYENRIDTRIF